MTFSFSDFASAVRAEGEVSVEQVLAARRWAWADGVITPDEADTIFELNHLVARPTADWTDFFVEALTEYLVNGVAPRGHVSDENARWLIDHVSRDGRVESHAEMELLVRVLEKAETAPDALRTFALAQIEREVLTGEGPTRRGGTLRPGLITDTEVALLRRLLYAGGSAEATMISRDEAEMLWALKDATLDAANAPGWRTLFVQAVARHLTGHGGRGNVTRADAARLDAFMADNRPGIGGFLGRMARALVERPGAAPAAMSADDRAVEAAAAAVVTAAEAQWLRTRMEADGRLDPLEQALLDFLAED
ncbi:hypothetical protein GVO57_02580 [Sphingomonas changnyeongensis]|uniref:Uncharacterized protein n=1 Tax=Sphingomonas changnyeongensis TaxID=2698679 RepID=A0A7Z2NU56_9SPHN|nr:hypothetical protein [Sphingomonas changnyeongensis]QHL89913.1 hypothetical protein GVO57_02580 [Sphingomonas changnyeongensis]